MDVDQEGDSVSSTGKQEAVGSPIHNISEKEQLLQSIEKSNDDTLDESSCVTLSKHDNGSLTESQTSVKRRKRNRRRKNKRGAVVDGVEAPGADTSAGRGITTCDDAALQLQDKLSRAASRTCSSSSQALSSRVTAERSVGSLKAEHSFKGNSVSSNGKAGPEESGKSVNSAAKSHENSVSSCGNEKLKSNSVELQSGASATKSKKSKRVRRRRKKNRSVQNCVQTGESETSCTLSTSISCSTNDSVATEDEVDDIASLHEDSPRNAYSRVSEDYFSLARPTTPYEVFNQGEELSFIDGAGVVNIAYPTQSPGGAGAADSRVVPELGSVLDMLKFPDGGSNLLGGFHTVDGNCMENREVRDVLSSVTLKNADLSAEDSSVSDKEEVEDIDVTNVVVDTVVEEETPKKSISEVYRETLDKLVTLTPKEEFDNSEQAEHNTEVRKSSKFDELRKYFEDTPEPTKKTSIEMVEENASLEVAPHQTTHMTLANEPKNSSPTKLAEAENTDTVAESYDDRLTFVEAVVKESIHELVVSEKEHGQNGEAVNASSALCEAQDVPDAETQTDDSDNENVNEESPAPVSLVPGFRDTGLGGVPVLDFGYSMESMQRFGKSEHESSDANSNDSSLSEQAKLHQQQCVKSVERLLIEDSADEISQGSSIFDADDHEVSNKGDASLTEDLLVESETSGKLQEGKANDSGSGVCAKDEEKALNVTFEIQAETETVDAPDNGETRKPDLSTKVNGDENAVGGTDAAGTGDSPTEDCSERLNVDAKAQDTEGKPEEKKHVAFKADVDVIPAPIESFIEEYKDDASEKSLQESDQNIKEGYEAISESMEVQVEPAIQAEQEDLVLHEASDVNKNLGAESDVNQTLEPELAVLGASNQNQELEAELVDGGASGMSQNFDTEPAVQEVYHSEQGSEVSEASDLKMNQSELAPVLQEGSDLNQALEVESRDHQEALVLGQNAERELTPKEVLELDQNKVILERAVSNDPLGFHIEDVVVTSIEVQARDNTSKLDEPVIPLPSEIEPEQQVALSEDSTTEHSNEMTIPTEQPSDESEKCNSEIKHAIAPEVLETEVCAEYEDESRLVASEASEEFESEMESSDSTVVSSYKVQLKDASQAGSELASSIPNLPNFTNDNSASFAERFKLGENVDENNNPLDDEDDFEEVEEDVPARNTVANSLASWLSAPSPVIKETETGNVLVKEEETGNNALLSSSTDISMDMKEILNSFTADETSNQVLPSDKDSGFDPIEEEARRIAIEMSIAVREYTDSMGGMFMTYDPNKYSNDIIDVVNSFEEFPPMDVNSIPRGVFRNFEAVPEFYNQVSNVAAAEDQESLKLENPGEAEMTDETEANECIETEDESEEGIKSRTEAESEEASVEPGANEDQNMDVSKPDVGQEKQPNDRPNDTTEKVPVGADANAEEVNAAVVNEAVVSVAPNDAMQDLAQSLQEQNIVQSPEGATKEESVVVSVTPDDATQDLAEPLQEQNIVQSKEGATEDESADKSSCLTDTKTDDTLSASEGTPSKNRKRSRNKKKKATMDATPHQDPGEGDSNVEKVVIPDEDSATVSLDNPVGESAISVGDSSTVAKEESATAIEKAVVECNDNEPDLADNGSPCSTKEQQSTVNEVIAQENVPSRSSKSSKSRRARRKKNSQSEKFEKSEESFAQSYSLSYSTGSSVDTEDEVDEIVDSSLHDDVQGTNDVIGNDVDLLARPATPDLLPKAHGYFQLQEDGARAFSDGDGRMDETPSCNADFIAESSVQDLLQEAAQYASPPDVADNHILEDKSACVTYAEEVDYKVKVTEAEDRQDVNLQEVNTEILNENSVSEKDTIEVEEAMLEQLSPKEECIVDETAYLVSSQSEEEVLNPKEGFVGGEAEKGIVHCIADANSGEETLSLEEGCDAENANNVAFSEVGDAVFDENSDEEFQQGYFEDEYGIGYKLADMKSFEMFFNKKAAGGENSVKVEVNEEAETNVDGFSDEKIQQGYFEDEYGIGCKLADMKSFQMFFNNKAAGGENSVKIEVNEEAETNLDRFNDASALGDSGNDLTDDESDLNRFTDSKDTIVCAQLSQCSLSDEQREPLKNSTDIGPCNTEVDQQQEHCSTFFQETVDKEGAVAKSHISKQYNDDSPREPAKTSSRADMVIEGSERQKSDATMSSVSAKSFKHSKVTPVIFSDTDDDMEDPLDSSEGTTVHGSDPALTETSVNPSDHAQSFVNSKSSVKVIYKVEANSYPCALESLMLVDPVTGLVDGPFLSSPDSQAPIEKFVSGEPSLGELWGKDNEDQYSAYDREGLPEADQQQDYDKNGNECSYHQNPMFQGPYSTSILQTKGIEALIDQGFLQDRFRELEQSKNESHVEDITSEDYEYSQGDQQDSEHDERVVDVSQTQSTGSVGYSLNVPNPSSENHMIDDKEQPEINMCSIARLALLKREHPDAVSHATECIDSVFSSAGLLIEDTETKPATEVNNGWLPSPVDWEMEVNPGLKADACRNPEYFNLPDNYQDSEPDEASFAEEQAIPQAHPEPVNVTELQENMEDASSESNESNQEASRVSQSSSAASMVSSEVEQKQLKACPENSNDLNETPSPSDKIQSVMNKLLAAQETNAIGSETEVNVKTASVESGSNDVAIFDNEGNITVVDALCSCSSADLAGNKSDLSQQITSKPIPETIIVDHIQQILPDTKSATSGPALSSDKTSNASTAVSVCQKPSFIRTIFQCFGKKNRVKSQSKDLKTPAEPQKSKAVTKRRSFSLARSKKVGINDD